MRVTVDGATVELIFFQLQTNNLKCRRNSRKFNLIEWERKFKKHFLADYVMQYKVDILCFDE